MFIVLALMGCIDPSGNGGETGNGIDGDTYAPVKVMPTIHGEPQDGYAIIVQDGEDIPVVAGDDSVAEAAQVKVGEAFTVLVGERAYVDRDGGPLLPIGDEYWYSPPVSDKLDDLPADVTTVQRPLSLHIQGEEVYCDADVWAYDESAPNYMGDYIGRDENLGPYDIQVKGAAEYSYTDDDGNKFSFQGAELISRSAGGTELIGAGHGTFVMIDDQLYFQNDEAQEELSTSITSWSVSGSGFSITRISMNTENEDRSQVVSATCTGLDTTRDAE